MKKMLLLAFLTAQIHVFGQQLYSATDSVMITNTNASPGADWGRGFEFIPNTTLYVQMVGKRVPSPGTYNYQIRIWEVATQTLVYDQALNTTTPDVYTYENINTSVVLNPGISYALTLYGSGPYFYESNSQVNSNLTFSTMRYCNSCPAYDFPTNTLGAYHYGLPDFLFSLVPPCDTYATITETTCESYTSPSGNYTWTSTGTYMDTIPNAAGCDSVLTIDLTIINNTSATLNETVCDSYTSPGGNYIWTNSGTYMDTIPSAAGCDSILTINLTVNQGDYLTDVLEACDSLTWIDGNTYTASNNTAYVSYTNTTGCDSIITLDLTITSIDASTSVTGVTITANGNGSYQWVDCDNNNSPISGETGPSFTPSVNGNYAVVVTDNNCVKMSDCVTISTIGLDEMDLSHFRISPNPSNGQFTVHSYSTVPELIKVTDINGKKVHEQTHTDFNTDINLGNCLPGVYIIAVQINGQMYTERLVIK